MIMSLFDSVVYFVRDIEESAKWCAELSGCEVQYENNNYAYLCVASGKLGFHVEDEKIKIVNLDKRFTGPSII